MMSSGASPPSVPISTSVAVRDYLETREFRCVGDLPEYWVQESSEKQFAKHHDTMRGRVNWLALVRSDEAADTDQFASPRHSRRVYPARPSVSLAHLGATDADRGYRSPGSGKTAESCLRQGAQARSSGRSRTTDLRRA